MPIISSLQNPLLKQVRRAVASGRPLENGWLAAEGPNILAEALAGEWGIERVFCSPNGFQQPRGDLLEEAARRNIEVTEVAEPAFAGISDTEHSQGIVVLLRPRQFQFADVVAAPGPLVILDGIQDPGNAGAMVRSAEAFSASGVVFMAGCVRVSNGKLLRAAAGSLFRLPYLEGAGLSEVVQQVQSAGRPLFALSAQGQRSLHDTSLTLPFALVVGSEGQGVSSEFLSAAQTLSIPTRQVESLNAAMACSITLFEAARQREVQS